jgi:hypothetical protein
MLKHIIEVIVVPTSLYHVPSKSMNLPLKKGNQPGKSASGTFEFAKSKIITVLIHSNKNNLGKFDSFCLVLFLYPSF